jgi:uncharacterized membrane protein
MSNWLEHSVEIEVNAPIDHVWQLWSDLEQMPRWMKWISSVKILEDNPELSRWKLDTGGLEFSWLSRIQQVVPQQIIQWESVDGLPNRELFAFMTAKPAVLSNLLLPSYPWHPCKIMDNFFSSRS